MLVIMYFKLIKIVKLNVFYLFFGFVREDKIFSNIFVYV